MKKSLLNRLQSAIGPRGRNSAAVCVKHTFTPCGTADSLLEAFTIAAISAVSGNVIALSTTCPNFGSFKKARVKAGDFESAARSAARRAVRRENLSRNGSRDFSLRRNFSEEKIPAPNKQPKIKPTSNRKDASRA